MTTATKDSQPTETGDSRDSALSVRHLWKIFGPRANNIIGTPEENLTRAELKEKTDCVAAVRDVSF